MKHLELIGKLGNQAGRAEGERERLTKLADDMPQRVAAVERLQKELDAARGIEGQLATAIREMKNRPLVCTECGTRHTLDGNVLVRITDDGGALTPPASPADVLNAEYTHTRARETVTNLDRLVQEGRRAIEAAAEARDLLSNWPAESPEIVALRGAIDAKEREMQTFEAAAIAQREGLKANERARHKTTLAKAHHQAVTDWLALRAQVAPDGLPSELLKGALVTFNATIASLASLLGWPACVIGQNMHVSRLGMPYELLSESAQWRVDVLLALALAEASGFRMVVLDRLDVLGSLGMRSALIGFYQLIKAGRIDSILLLGTMAKPPVVPADVGVHWLGPVAQEVAA